MVSFYTIEIARTFCRRSCCCCCCRYNRSGGGTDTSSAGVGDVELPAVPKQRVVDQMVDTVDLAWHNVVGSNEALCRLY